MGRPAVHKQHPKPLAKGTKFFTEFRAVVSLQNSRGDMLEKNALGNSSNLTLCLRNNRACEKHHRADVNEKGIADVVAIRLEVLEVKLKSVKKSRVLVTYGIKYNLRVRIHALKTFALSQ